jgi:hypothetical protein
MVQPQDDAALVFARLFSTRAPVDVVEPPARKRSILDRSVRVAFIQSRASLTVFTGLRVDTAIASARLIRAARARGAQRFRCPLGRERGTLCWSPFRFARSHPHWTS